MKLAYRPLLAAYGSGGGVWESNPPERALANSPTVLKTAPITGQDAPPLKILGLSNDLAEKWQLLAVLIFRLLSNPSRAVFLASLV